MLDKSAIEVTMYYDDHGRVVQSRANNRFSQTLYYQDALDGKPVYYNGNISAVKWGTGATQDKKYHFSYDGLNRMTEAIYSPDHLFDERITSYDKHGNILTMDRCGWIQEYNDEEPIQGDIDNLQMTYQGNQLISAHDNIADWEERMNNDFYDVSDENHPKEYYYDANGNQYADLNKGIAWIKYNLLNLPEKILFQNGNKIEYLYDATGVKRQAVSSYSTTTQNIPLGSTVVVSYNLQKTTTTQYYGNYVYEKGILKRILTPEGYIETFGSTTSLGFLGMWRYTYFLKDYQGNVRHQLYGDYLTSNTNVLHSSTSVDYYPFGMQISNSDGTLTSGTNPYLYNGKEIDRMHGLNQYDYGARWRDGALPAWTTVDPLAEDYYDVSPYAYCGNDPVNRIDPDGMDYWSTNDPEQIKAFISALKNNVNEHDFSSWNHISDAKFVTDYKATFNDETGKFHTSYATTESGETTVIGVTVDTNINPGLSSFGWPYKGLQVYPPVDEDLLSKAAFYVLGWNSTYNTGNINWKVNSLGRVTGVQPIQGMPPAVGMKGKLVQRGGKYIQTMGKAKGSMTGNHIAQNQQARAIAKKLGLNLKEQDQLHRLIGGQGYSYQEALREAKAFFNK